MRTHTGNQTTPEGGVRLVAVAIKALPQEVSAFANELFAVRR
jgi:hypothetical protein